MGPSPWPRSGTLAPKAEAARQQIDIVFIAMRIMSGPTGPGLGQHAGRASIRDLRRPAGRFNPPARLITPGCDPDLPASPGPLVSGRLSCYPHGPTRDGGHSSMKCLDYVLGGGGGGGTPVWNAWIVCGSDSSMKCLDACVGYVSENVGTLYEWRLWSKTIPILKGSSSSVHVIGAILS